MHVSFVLVCVWCSCTFAQVPGLNCNSPEGAVEVARCEQLLFTGDSGDGITVTDNPNPALGIVRFDCACARQLQICGAFTSRQDFVAACCAADDFYQNCDLNCTVGGSQCPPSGPAPLPSCETPDGTGQVPFGETFQFPNCGQVCTCVASNNPTASTSVLDCQERCAIFTCPLGEQLVTSPNDSCCQSCSHVPLGGGGGTNGNGVNECEDGSHTCDPNAICTDDPVGFTCECPQPRFTGDGKTCTDVNECTEGTHGCDANAVCINTIGSHTCQCRVGFTGNGFNCNDINECTTGTHSCHINAICTNTIGVYTCRCGDGFVGDGLTCARIDVNECVLGTHNCHANATCYNTAMAFTCQCARGFIGDGVSCVDVNECATTGSFQTQCGANAVCINTIGSYSCRCLPGYVGDGLVCTGINECTTGIHTCHPDAVCINTEASYTCQCRVGFTGNGTTCTEIKCTIPPTPSNGFERSIVGGSRAAITVGTTIQYSCSSGYHMIGREFASCLSTGLYDFPPPLCLQCSEIVDPTTCRAIDECVYADGLKECTDKVVCRSLSTVYGCNQHRMCQWHKLTTTCIDLILDCNMAYTEGTCNLVREYCDWTMNGSRCVKGSRTSIQCNIHAPMGGFVQPKVGFIGIGDVITYGCVADNELKGKPFAVCLENGNLDSQPPVCQESTIPPATPSGSSAVVGPPTSIVSNDDDDDSLEAGWIAFIVLLVIFVGMMTLCLFTRNTEFHFGQVKQGQTLPVIEQEKEVKAVQYGRMYYGGGTVFSPFETPASNPNPIGENQGTNIFSSVEPLVENGKTQDWNYNDPIVDERPVMPSSPAPFSCTFGWDNNWYNSQHGQAVR